MIPLHGWQTCSPLKRCPFATDWHLCLVLSSCGYSTLNGPKHQKQSVPISNKRRQKKNHIKYWPAKTKHDMGTHVKRITKILKMHVTLKWKWFWKEELKDEGCRSDGGQCMEQLQKPFIRINVGLLTRLGCFVSLQWWDILLLIYCICCHTQECTVYINMLVMLEMTV